MDWSGIAVKPSRTGRDAIIIGLYLLILALFLLAGLAVVGVALGGLRDVLLLRDIVGVTTALPIYLMILVAFGLIAKGLILVLIQRLKTNFRTP